MEEWDLPGAYEALARAHLTAGDKSEAARYKSLGLEAIAKLRNDAAHGGDFTYTEEQVETAIKEVQAVLTKLLGGA